MALPVSDAPPTRRGPRGLRGEVRGQILSAARRMFAESGWKGPTIRDVATTAGVDPRTVAYYFPDRPALLAAALSPPPGFLEGIERINAVPLEKRGRALVRALLRGWSAPASRELLALVVGVGMQHPPSVAGLKEIYQTRFVGSIASGLDSDDAGLRAALVAAEMVSVSVSRFVWRLEPLASLSDRAVIDLVGPQLQRYLSGELTPSITGASGS